MFFLHKIIYVTKLRFAGSASELLNVIDNKNKRIKKSFYFSRLWNENNVAIKISTDNLQTQQGCTKMIMDAAKVGPVKGIFVVPDIETKTNDKAEDFVIKYNKTINAVINLSMTSKTYCNDLRYFFVFCQTSCYIK